jgi:cytoskeletal protein RodZ
MNGIREADADTPATTTTRPLYVGTGYDLGIADDADGPWSAAVDAQNAALPDFSQERRWTSVVLGALGIVVLAALVIAVITVAHQSSEPTEPVPAPAPTSTSAVVPSPAATTTSAPAPTTPPTYSSVTATASTVVAPPPPVIQPGEPQPKPGVRQRLHDLFPRLFPGQ